MGEGAGQEMRRAGMRSGCKGGWRAWVDRASHVQAL